MEYVIWTSICLIVTQFMTAGGFLIYNTREFSSWSKKHDRAIKTIANDNDNYRYSYRDPDKCKNEMKYYSKWSRVNALITATSPLSPVLIPVIIVLATLYGIKAGLQSSFNFTKGKLAPALTYKEIS